MKHTALVVLGTVAAACATARGTGNDAPCWPVAGTLPAGATLALMEGRFVLTLVATAGRRSGQSIGGYLTLRAAPPGTPPPAAGTRTALIGATEVGLEAVGALRLGDTGAENPRAPGVAVYEQRATSGVPTVTARIGSETTAVPATGLTQIESAYTVLYVRGIGPAGFSGGWASSSGRAIGTEAQGHFCAVRVAG